MNINNPIYGGGKGTESGALCQYAHSFSCFFFY